MPTRTRRAHGRLPSCPALSLPAGPSAGRATLAVLAWLAAFGSQAAEPALERLESSTRLGIETLRLPGGERVGLVGASYLLGLAEPWYLGPAVYGAASGSRGGLFVIGGETAWRGHGPFGSRVEAGLFVGGGGGAAAPVGGGLMLRPHLDLAWPLGPGWLGVSASRVSFPNGRIGSNQLGLAYTIDGDFRHAAPGATPALGAGRAGLGFDRWWGTVGRYQGGTARYGYGGLRADRWLQPGVYAGLEAAGAAQGGADGYAEILASLGGEWPIGTPAGRALPTVGLRAAAGLAGGGAIDTGGGPVLKLAATLHWNPVSDLLLGLEAGRTVAPDGRWRATHLQVSLGLVLDRPPASGEAEATASLRSDTLAWSAAAAHFPRMRLRDGSRDAVQTVGLRLGRPLHAAFDERLQLTGSVHFAAGGKAGAYGAGLIGLAWASPLTQPGWQFGVELLGGAAGGGGVDTRGGAVLQPMLRAGWASGAQRLHIGIGQLRALRGGLDTPVIELSYGAVIGVPTRH